MIEPNYLFPCPRPVSLSQHKAFNCLPWRHIGEALYSDTRLGYLRPPGRPILQLTALFAPSLPQTLLIKIRCWVSQALSRSRNAKQ